MRRLFLVALLTVAPLQAADKPLTPEQARARVGERVALEMTVAAVKDRLEKRGEIYLDSEDDFRSEKNFAVVITRAGAESLAKAGVRSPAEHFGGKAIRAAGVVKEVDGVPRLEIDDAKKIQLVTGSSGKKLNVLFFSIDDLKPALACAGDPHAKTPNIDRLAKLGTVFKRAYCQQAVCSPSRSSLMTGRRPDTTKVWDLNTHFRKALPDVVTLSQHFKANGYYVHGMGKIFHGGYNDAPSWSVPWEGTKGKNFGPDGLKLMGDLRAKAKADGADVSRVRGRPVEAPDVADDFLNDGWTASRAVEVLKERKGKTEPFFLAVGFVKPHLPFVAPKKYWDLYDPAKLPMPETTEPPADAPKFAPQFGGELRAYHDIPKSGLLSKEQTRKLVHGYYAAVSYMDAQVGRVLDALDQEGFADNTAIILWGDHGWHLGDHGMWCKHTNYEKATRAALVMAVPGQKVKGKGTDALVEFVDIYPTLVEVCGLPKAEGVEGYSFAPLLDDPSRAWKAAAFSQYPRGGGKDVGRVMGYAVVTDRYRYVEWRKRDGTEVVARELYDHKTDPNEDKNVAGDPANQPVIARHAKLLADGWKANTPPTK